jgi:hypothetical protein
VNELFDLMLADFGISVDTRLKGSSLGRLNQWLIERYRMGRNAVLILDEAQGLPAHVLEEIRMLLNHELANEKLLQIVLSGQPELEEKLKRPELRQIRQRISLRCQTAALTLEEAHGYIQKRLRIAGGTGDKVFVPEAINSAYLYSRGIPRVMNLLCEHAMIRAYLEQTQPVPVSMVDEVASELQFDDLKPETVRPSSEGSLRARPSMPTFEECEAVPAAMPRDRQDTMRRRLEIIAPHLKTACEVPSAFADGLKTETEGKPQPNSIADIDAKPRSIRDVKTEVIVKEASRASGDPQPDSPKRSTAVSAEKRDRRSFLHLSRLRQATYKGRKLGDELPSALGLISHWISDGWVTTVALAKSPAWRRTVESLIRWLQQPLPTVKLHRRAHH